MTRYAAYVTARIEFEYDGDIDEAKYHCEQVATPETLSRIEVFTVNSIAEYTDEMAALEEQEYIDDTN